MTNTKKSLTKQDVIKLAQLANLQVTDAELDRFQSQLEETLQYVENLNELNTEATTPTDQVTSLSNVTFADGTPNSRGLSPEEVLQNAEYKKGNYFVVKRIMEE